MVYSRYVRTPGLRAHTRAHVFKIRLNPKPLNPKPQTRNAQPREYGAYHENLPEGLGRSGSQSIGVSKGLGFVVEGLGFGD